MMRRSPFSYPTVLAILLASAAGCSHPQTGGDGDNTTSSSSSGQTSTSGSGSGQTATGSGSGSGGGTTTTTTSGAGGGQSTTGGSTTGGGSGEVIVVTDGGAGGAPMVTKMACADAVYKSAYTPGYVVDPGVQGQVSSTLQKLSLTEKADQMRGTDPGNGQNFTDIFRSPDNTSKGIKGFLFRDGPRGVNLDAPLPSGTSTGKSTVFPVPMARGASWDLNLELRIGEAMGDEMVASGQTMLLAPTTNILRHPLWGRAQETYGEDAFQLGRFGSASVVGNSRVRSRMRQALRCQQHRERPRDSQRTDR